jgi:hypothetical protein
MIYHLENLAQNDDLTPAVRLELREQLEALAQPEVSEEEQVRRWGRVRALAPSLWDSGQKIIVNVISDVVKRELGL